MPKSSPASPALAFIALAWANIPGGSWQRLNQGMYWTLRVAIASKMKFEENDVVEMGNRFRAHRWITDGGEGLYALACGSDRGSENPGAAIAMEKWLGRPAYLWAERTKTPDRLHRGAQFNWQGQYVTVTSLSKDHLIACTYKDGSDRAIDRRIRITHEELTAARKAMDGKRKALLKELTAATSMEELKIVRERIVAEKFNLRHFDTEELLAAFGLAGDRIRRTMKRTEEEQAVQRWLAGESVGYISSREVLLRIKDGWVETTNGQRATVKGARLALAFIKKHRTKGWSANGETFAVDNFPLESITAKGVQVGCTFITHEEINRIALTLLKTAL